MADARTLEPAKDQGMAMGENTLAALEIAHVAASSDPLPRCGEQALAVLRRWVPFDSAWGPGGSPPS
jgi:hypothetical protein